MTHGDVGIGVGGAVYWLTSGLGVCSLWDGWWGFSFASQVVVVGVSMDVIWWSGSSEVMMVIMCVVRGVVLVMVFVTLCVGLFCV